MRLPAPAWPECECGQVEGCAKPQLTLLRDISGAFRPGRLTTLMGSSGAGKTTLMDVSPGLLLESHVLWTVLRMGAWHARSKRAHSCFGRAGSRQPGQPLLMLQAGLPSQV